MMFSVFLGKWGRGLPTTPTTPLKCPVFMVIPNTIVPTITHHDTHQIYFCDSGREWVIVRMSR